MQRRKASFFRPNGSWRCCVVEKTTAIPLLAENWRTLLSCSAQQQAKRAEFCRLFRVQSFSCDWERGGRSLSCFSSCNSASRLREQSFRTKNLEPHHVSPRLAALPSGSALFQINDARKGVTPRAGTKRKERPPVFTGHPPTHQIRAQAHQTPEAQN